MRRKKTSGETNAKRSFTLVELLVVVAVVMILLSLMAPALSAAKQSGKRISCAGNLKQLGVGLYSYYDSYGLMPPAYDNYTTGSMLGFWWRYLYRDGAFKLSDSSDFPNAFNCKLLTCPSDTDVAAANTGVNAGKNCCSYGQNFKLAILLGYNPPTAGHLNRLEAFIEPAKISAPGTRILTGDCDDAHFGRLYDPGDIGYPADCYRHVAGANFLFLDGHVSYLKAPIADYSRAFGLTE